MPSWMTTFSAFWKSLFICRMIFTPTLKKCHPSPVTLRSSLRTWVLSCNSMSEITECRTNHITSSSVAWKLTNLVIFPLLEMVVAERPHSLQIISSHKIHIPTLLQKICARSKQCFSCMRCRQCSENYRGHHETHRQLPHYGHEETARYFVYQWTGSSPTKCQWFEI